MTLIDGARMFSGFQAWRESRKQRYRRWWMARLQPSDELRLDIRNVYILPTRFGWMFGFMLFVLLLTAISYQSNLSYLLTFLLAATGTSAMFITTGVLRGLHVHARLPQTCFATEPLALELVLRSSDAQHRYAIGLRFYESQKANPVVWADVASHSQTTTTLQWSPTQRGRQTMPWIVLETRFPLGLFRAWAVWQMASDVLVFPRPEKGAPAWPTHAAQDGHNRSGATARGEELDGVRAYRRGDPLKWVLWKKFAKSDELVSREWATGSSEIVWFDYANTLLSDREGRLSRLSAWLLRAEELGLTYGLRLPRQPDIKAATGLGHLHHCLTQLALFE